MTDYYPLIARAVTGLDKGTGEARRALYERARTALVAQLRGVEPALTEAHITRERLALEEAIRKVEAEAARRPRQQSPEFSRANLAAPRLETPDREAVAPAKPPPERSGDEPPPEPSGDEPPLPFEPPSQPDHAAPGGPAPRSEAAPTEPSTAARNARFSGLRTSLVDESLKGFRGVEGQTDDRGESTASAARSAREVRAAGPPPNQVERTGARLRPENLARSGRAFPLASPRPQPRAGQGGRPLPPHPDPEEFDELEEQSLRRRRGGVARKIIALAVVVVLAAAAFFAYLEWGGNITGMLQSGRSPATQVSKEAPQARPKISDRIGGAQQDSPARPARNTGAAVAQRAVLYEQQTDPQERKQYVGSVIWRTETTSPGPGQPADVAVKAEVEIPERHMRMNFTVRRNLDASLPASHTIEVLFSTPSDFQPGGIADVPSVLMEDTEQRSGTPLTGLRVKVTSGFFLVGLSSVESDVKRNVQLLKERPWLHIRISYNNGQRALLAIEKGIPGDRAFEEALNAWGQNPPQPSR